MRNISRSWQLSLTAYQRATGLPSDKLPRLRFSRSEAPIMPQTLWFTHPVHGLATGSPLQIRFPPIRRLRPTSCLQCFRVGDTSLHSYCVEVRSLSRPDRHAYRDPSTRAATTSGAQSEKRPDVPGLPTTPRSLAFGMKLLHSAGAESPELWRNQITWTRGNRHVCSRLSTSQWPMGSSPDSRLSMNSISGAQ